MKHPILGLHHVTATVDGAQEDLDFYRDTLGLRLVKRTVNFDNPQVYHFYYGDERGTPGTIWTTFPYQGWGVARGQHGRGQITSTTFSVPKGALDFWTPRLGRQGTTEEAVGWNGSPTIRFKDPSGLAIELIENRDDQREPWTGSGITAEYAIRGLHSVRLRLAHAERTVRLMTELLGFEQVAEDHETIRLAVNGDVPGHRVELAPGTGGPEGRNGLGTVHHVAMAIASGDQQVRLRHELIGLGYSVTEVLDRQYFQSIYFREPGGVLFEVATAGPGFTVDEPLAELGIALKLPPWEEPNRSSIEEHLPRISPPPPLQRPKPG
jgi:glyoxalase family protein